MILNEILRLNPLGVMHSRIVHGETKLAELLYRLKQLFLLSILLHLDEQIWGADGKEFNPERCNDEVANATKGQHVFVPFGSGPRVCISQNFAMLEAKMALSMILQHFSFELSPSYAHAPHTVIILQPQYGAQLIVRKVQCQN